MDDSKIKQRKSREKSKSMTNKKLTSLFLNTSSLFIYSIGLLIGYIQKVNFVVSQVVALALAAIFRTVLHPSKATAASRHIFGLTFGLLIGYFCFGIQAIHLATLPTSCYIVIRTTNPQIMQRMVLAVAISYLSAIHVHRQMYDYGSYTLDITGPLMVITQKVTSLAFNLHDGLTKTTEQMSKTQQIYAVRRIPTFLEYFGFTLQFPTLMAGPALFYRDYIDFIDGRNLSTTISNDNGQMITKTIIIEPSPKWCVCKKVSLAIIYAIIFLTFAPMFPTNKLKDDEFLDNTSFVQKLLYLYICTTPVRFKYYLAWTLADAICNNAGIGYDQQHDNWNKFTNVDIIQFEFGRNLRESIDGWNLGTNRWLRYIVYERVNKYGMVLTYTLSAIWHGFYPGYYITFANGALFTAASRSMRRTVRNYFLVNTETKLFYDVLTMIFTRILMGYIVFTFVILEFWPCIRVYMYLYWCIHLCGLLAIFVVPKVILKTVAGSKSSISEALSQARPITNGISRSS